MSVIAQELEPASFKEEIRRDLPTLRDKLIMSAIMFRYVTPMIIEGITVGPFKELKGGSSSEELERKLDKTFLKSAKFVLERKVGSVAFRSRICDEVKKVGIRRASEGIENFRQIAEHNWQTLTFPDWLDETEPRTS